MPIRKLIPASLALFLCTSSCVLASGKAPTSVLEIFSTPVSTPTGAERITPSASSVSLDFECLQILNTKPASLSVSGEIILRNYQGNGPLLALDPSNGQMMEILSSSGPHTIAAVSPGQQLLAYRDNDSTGKGDRLVLVDSHFVIRKSIPWQEGWLAIGNWINNEQLALLKADPETRMVILDSVTGLETPVSFSQLPDFSNSVTHPWVEFDPTEKRVLYPILGDAYSLFDLVNRKSIARLPSWTSEAPDASWSADGKFIAVTGPSPKYHDNLGGSYEIYALSRNGNIEQVTHLADYYGRNLGLYSPRWSPDGKKLAFWIQHTSNGTPNYVLGVVDIITRTATNLCITSDPSGYGGEFHEALPSPIWSPDGQQIIVESRYSEDHNRVILVDLANKTAVQIGQDARPVGWMVMEP
jgi:WD40-like Beta Propeller Repeat